ncbi:Hypothetical predicted protein [Pelobates cultripes]|uniref:Uncharacterized protein n=1 Tax=Pelobates cultripes TaxID=61616 RepID=A0AAD1W7F3_PELCU|nr:Hypothetical predicted protein [Pelobates cultripes]
MAGESEMVAQPGTIKAQQIGTPDAALPVEKQRDSPQKPSHCSTYQCGRHPTPAATSNQIPLSSPSPHKATNPAEPQDTPARLQPSEENRAETSDHTLGEQLHLPPNTTLDSILSC